jgi:hypothetical protein
MAKQVNGKLSQPNDAVIEGYFNEVVVAVVNGEKTKAQALADFRAIVETQFGL